MWVLGRVGALDFHDWKSQQQWKNVGWFTIPQKKGRFEADRIKCPKHGNTTMHDSTHLKQMLVQLDAFFHKKGQRELQNTDRPHMYTTPTTHRPTRWAFLLGSTHLEYPPLASSDEHSEKKHSNDTGPWNLPRGHLYDTNPLVVEPTQLKNMLKSNWIIAQDKFYFYWFFQGLLYDTNPNFMHHCTGKCLKTTIMYLHCFSHVFIPKMGPISWPLTLHMEKWPLPSDTSWDWLKVKLPLLPGSWERSSFAALEKPNMTMETCK